MLITVALPRRFLILVASDGLSGFFINLNHRLCLKVKNAGKST
jgi:hypothetical protein